MRARALLAALLLSVVVSCAMAEEPKWFVAPALDKAPSLELGLADPAWGKALKIPFKKLDDAPGDTTKYPCESYWLRAGDSLFVGFKFVNADSPKLWATPNQIRDQSIYRSESVELFVGDIAGDLYYQFIFDSAGNVFDGMRLGNKWDGDEKYRVKCEQGFWTLVVEIPGPILSTIWSPGSFVTMTVVRHGFNPDGSGEERVTISPLGVHSPKDKVFLGNINPALLGEKTAGGILGFRQEFAKAKLPKSAVARLASLEAFVAECGGAGDVPLERYRELFKRYIDSGRELVALEQEIVMDNIFSEHGAGL